jgi:hypothetical protein
MDEAFGVIVVGARCAGSRVGGGLSEDSGQVTDQVVPFLKEVTAARV